MQLQNATTTVLITPKLYVDWWGWGSPPNDPGGEIPAVEDFFQNLGGSRWLNTVTQYHTSQGNPGNPIDLWGGEWFGSTNPLPVGSNGRPCKKNSDCASSLCNVSTGKCYPTNSQFVTEVNTFLTNSGFNPPDDGMIAVLTPPAVPNPGFALHDSTTRTGHKSIVFIENAYVAANVPNLTFGLMHEIQESITDPRTRDPNGTAWQDACACEVSDRCNPPPDGSPGSLYVGESPTADWAVQSMWSDNSRGGAGGCVLAYSTHEDWYFQGRDGNLWHSPNLVPGWLDNYGHPTNVNLAGGPGAASWSNGRQDAFVLGSDGQVWQWRQAPGIPPAWVSWVKPPGTVQFEPDAFSWRPQRLDVVVVSRNASAVNEVWRKAYTDDTWIDWQNWGKPVGVTINSRPGTASWGPNRIDVFFLSTESPPNIWHGYSSDGGTTIGWNQSPGGHPTGITLVSVDAASWGDQRIDVVALGSDGNVWQQAWDHGSLGNWTNWGNPGATLAFGPGAVGAGEGRLDVTSQSLTDTFYDRFWNWGLGPWYSDARRPPAWRVGSI
jgi:hypothetical protein